MRIRNQQKAALTKAFKGKFLAEDFSKCGSPSTYDAASGQVHIRGEGGHSARRVVHAADATGREIERTLLAQVANHRFDNMDASGHTATSGVPGCPDANWDTGTITGQSAKCVKLNAAGSYPFFCAVHPSMTGTLSVSN